MTARYGLPDRLFNPIAFAVRLAWETSAPNEAFHNGTDVQTITALWKVRVSKDRHTDLLAPWEAEELLRVVQDGIEANAAWLSVGDRYFEDDFQDALDLELYSEEIVASLTEIIVSGSVVV
jgi:hypothetical protein